MISIKSKREIEYMRAAGKIVALIHQELKKIIIVGATGKQLDLCSKQIIKEHNGTSSFFGYHGFPATICVSVNEQLIHGIPNDKPFKNGDIVKIDAGAAVNGYHADAAFTVCVGNPSATQEKLINVTAESLNKAIAMIRPGVRVGDISFTIQTYVESHGFCLPTSYTGHGIGKLLHEEPAIPNAGLKPNTGFKLQAGMTICIEPMVQISTDEVKVLKDGWTVVAKDNQDTAHFEHTILITNDGCEVLTKI